MRRVILLCFGFLYFLKLGAQICSVDSFVGPDFFDTYFEYINDTTHWTIYNVHDPTVNKDGEWYYMYCTDVALGTNPGSGAHKRRSKDLIHWEYLGKAFNGVPQSAVNFFKIYNPGYTDQGIWAPFLHKFRNQYRLYYAAPGGLSNQPLAFIGYATSSSANGPWTDQGEVTASVPNDTINAIDPTVIYDSLSGKLWMAYGSYQTGIYCLELDTATGGLKTPGDRGIRIAGRSGGRNAAIEAPEFTYHNGWYYLFVSYDWLEDFYNIRVGRSTSPNGPYYDFKGKNMADYTDNIPMIESPYQFNNHEGWQGTGHCSVYNDSGTYYMFNQARPSGPGNTIYNMVLHVRKIYWIDNWPVVSPERYADVPQCPITANDLVGKWEYMLLIYSKSKLHSTSTITNLAADGTIDGDATNTWTLNDSLLTLSWNGGQSIDKTIISRAWDWENRCTTIVFTGINQSGQCMWGKKVNQAVVDRNTIPMNGGIYKIRNFYSNKLMEVANGTDANGTNVYQISDNGKGQQLWVLDSTGSGYKLISYISPGQRALEVVNNSSTNGTNVQLGDNINATGQYFDLNYLGNGYFSILTDASNYASALDVENFSTVNGGNIFQWQYLGGLNQQWRIEKVDSIYIPSGIKQTFTAETNVDVYPNPSDNGEITIRLNNMPNSGGFSMAVYNNLGECVLRNPELSGKFYRTHLSLPSGLYFLVVSGENESFTQKIVIK